MDEKRRGNSTLYISNISIFARVIYTCKCRMWLDCLFKLDLWNYQKKRRHALKQGRLILTVGWALRLIQYNLVLGSQKLCLGHTLSLLICHDYLYALQNKRFKTILLVFICFVLADLCESFYLLHTLMRRTELHQIETILPTYLSEQSKIITLIGTYLDVFQNIFI